MSDYCDICGVHEDIDQNDDGEEWNENFKKCNCGLIICVDCFEKCYIKGNTRGHNFCKWKINECIYCTKDLSKKEFMKADYYKYLLKNIDLMNYIKKKLLKKIKKDK